MKRLVLTLPLALSPFLSGCLGCNRPAEPPPPQRGAPPAMRQPAGMPGLPPDPRAGRPGTAPASNPGRTVGSGSVGISSLPAKPVSGSALNKFFPSGVTFTQEKNGFSMANLKGGGTIAITDLASNPSARDKFKMSSESVSGYPASRVGQQGLAVLVGDRYQVMVRGTSSAEGVLGSAKLSELAGLK
jgi:hypothetical protein